MFLRSFRLLLFPFSVLYGMVVWLRNQLFDKGILHTTRFNLPTICVGNLSLGGTGKSPMVEFLIISLRERYRLATLSRGYRRRTVGYVLAGKATTALEIGDEPMQFHQKFPDVAVAVGEKRVEALPQLLFDRPETEVVILDDAFQHRSILAGLNILLTDHGNLYTRDLFLPAGDLRDARSRASAADILIVTKCPENLSIDSARLIEAELRLSAGQQLFFSSIEYGTPYRLTDRGEVPLTSDREVLLICGIANPDPLKAWLEQHMAGYEMMRFRDHHIFDIDDLQEIRHKFLSMPEETRTILTTEKDAVRLLKFGSDMRDLPILVLPIRMHFLFGAERDFRRNIDTFIASFGDPDSPLRPGRP